MKKNRPPLINTKTNNTNLELSENEEKKNHNNLVNNRYHNQNVSSPKFLFDFQSEGIDFCFFNF